MVTKNTRLQSRHTTVDGRVPGAGDLLAGELAINLPDRKVYTKDDDDNVFQIGGAPGRSVGNYLAYENFVGSGLQGIGIQDGGRIWFRRDNDKTSDHSNVWITRNIPSTATDLGTPGFVAAALRIDHTINKAGLAGFEWGAVINMVYEPGEGSSGGGEHVALYPRVEKRGAANLWAICGEMRDYTDSPTNASVGQELTLLATGLDPSNQRLGLHISMNSASGADGTNVWSDGIVVGGPIAKVQAKRLLRLQGASLVGIDMSELETGYADTGIRMRKDHNITWVDNINSTTNSGSLRWSSVLNTFQISGIPISMGAPSAADRKAMINIGGQNYYIALTLAP